jgi:hypothetical protein
MPILSWPQLIARRDRLPQNPIKGKYPKQSSHQVDHLLIQAYSSSASTSRSHSKSDPNSIPAHRSGYPRNTSSEKYSEHDEAASDDVDVTLAHGQDPQVLRGASSDPHHNNLQTNPTEQYTTTTSPLHIPASCDVGSASQMASYAFHQTDYSQYSPTRTDSTWGTSDQHFISFSDTPIQNDTSSNYQDNQVQLQQWAYQISNCHLTVAERLEKANWEAKRHERL